MVNTIVKVDYLDSYSFFELEAGISGLTGRYTAKYNFCPSVSDRFRAMRK